MERIVCAQSGEDMLLTGSSCKHDGEEIDAHCDGVEDRKSFEAIGGRISLWMFM